MVWNCACTPPRRYGRREPAEEMGMKKIGAGEVFQLVKESAKDFSDDECPRVAAALAYYTVFALPPLLILILMLVGAFVSRETVSQALSGQVGGMIGHDGAKTIDTMITQAKQPGGGVIATILGLGAVVLGATGAFMQLQTALDRAWEVKPDPNAGGIKNFIFKRVLSLGMVLGIAFLLLVSLALSAALTAVGGGVGSPLPRPAPGGGGLPPKPVLPGGVTPLLSGPLQGGP